MSSLPPERSLPERSLPERARGRSNALARQNSDPLADPIDLRYPDHAGGGSSVEAPGLLVEYASLIARNKIPVLLMGLAGLALAALYTLPKTPIYQARTSVELQGLNENFLNMKSSDPASSLNDYSPEGYIQTQIKILQSSTLVARVMDKLKTVPPGETAAPPPVSGWRTALHLGNWQTQPRDQLLAYAAGSLQVRAAGNTHIIEILADSPDPRLAADFANTMVKEYIEHNFESRLETTRKTGEWLQNQLQDLKRKLEKSETELLVYALGAGLQFTNDKTSVAEDKLRQLQQELLKAQSDRVLQQTKFETAASRPIETLPEIIDDSMLREEQGRLVELRRQYAEFSATLTPEHPKVERVDAQIAELQKAMELRRDALLKRIRNDFESAGRREKLLYDEYMGQSRVLTDQSGKSIRYDILKREVDTNRQLYDALLQRVKEGAITAAMRASNISMVDRAFPPAVPYKPNLLTNMLLGLVMGLTVGIAFVVIRERADRTIQLPGETERYLHVPELGVIPAARSELLNRAMAKTTLPLPEPAGDGNAVKLPERAELITSYRRPSIVAEAFRSTLASLLFAWQRDRDALVMVFSSAAPAEGKTMVTCNLAAAMAETHRRVLLIDADLRKPRVHQVFGLENRFGLSDLLRRPDALTEAQVSEMVHGSGVRALDIMTSGPGASDLSTLLYSSRVAELFALLRKSYDAVLIDTPPMLHMPDARILARHADGVIMIVRAGRTTRDKALLARERFQSDGTPILGTVLNDWNVESRSGYGAYYKGYHDYYEAESASPAAETATHATAAKDNELSISVPDK